MTSKSVSKIGFVKAGTCLLDASLKGGVRFNLTCLQKDRVIYAFAVDQKVKYVGICHDPTTSLSDRMRRYQSRAGAGANKRITRCIKAALKKSNQVTILAWQPKKKITVAGCRVDLVRGLESALIKRADGK